MPSFNVQNAKSLEITEGNVAAIHDANGKQLWGALYYDVSYKGDCKQDIITGKNLLNPTPYSTGGFYNQNVGTQLTNTFDASITVSTAGNKTSIVGTASYKGAVFVSTPLTVGQTYLFSGEASIDIENQHRATRYMLDSTFTVTRKIGNTTSGSSTTYDITVTPEAGEVYFAVYEGVNSRGDNPSFTLECTDFQIEAGQTKTDWEQYVGGIPSPSPDYPQPINVVTGTQTITLTGGTVSEDYTVGLGSIELCKIGTYQDYIYKNEGSWYKHKEIDKITLTGSETWSEQWSGRKSYATVITNPLRTADGDTVATLKSYYYTATTVNDLYGQRVDYGASIATGSNLLLLRNKDCADTTAFKTWLNNHNTTVYYALATATDTQITDTTLISQLEAVEEFLRRYGYTSTVVGNLPIIIDRDAL